MTTNLDLSERASEGKKTIGRSVSVNGVHAVDLEVKQSENLNDPLLDINFKVNNPIGRLVARTQAYLEESKYNYLSHVSRSRS